MAETNDKDVFVIDAIGEDDIDRELKDPHTDQVFRLTLFEKDNRPSGENFVVCIEVGTADEEHFEDSNAEEMMNFLLGAIMKFQQGKRIERDKAEAEQEFNVAINAKTTFVKNETTTKH